MDNHTITIHTDFLMFNTNSYPLNVIDIDEVRRLNPKDQYEVINKRHTWLKQQKLQDKKELRKIQTKIYNFNSKQKRKRINKNDGNIIRTQTDKQTA